MKADPKVKLSIVSQHKVKGTSRKYSALTTSGKHRCNLSAHARVLSLIEGKWRILKELCCFGFQEDKRCFFFPDCSLIIWKRQQRVLCFWRPRIIAVNQLQTP